MTVYFAITGREFWLIEVTAPSSSSCAVGFCTCMRHIPRLIPCMLSVGPFDHAVPHLMKPNLAATIMAHAWPWACGSRPWRRGPVPEKGWGY